MVRPLSVSGRQINVVSRESVQNNLNIVRDDSRVIDLNILEGYEVIFILANQQAPEITSTYSTAGVVLRLEVLHYDIMTNSRGRDVVIGFVDIPLSDIPNANLRRPDYQDSGTTKRRRKLGYNGDGFCEKWYRLNSLSDLKGDLFLLSKPISNPQKEKPAWPGALAISGFHHSRTAAQP